MESTQDFAADLQDMAPLDATLAALLMAHGASAVCVYDEEDRVIRWNARYLEFFPEVKGMIRVGLPFLDTLLPFLAHQHPHAPSDEMDAAIRSALHRHRTDEGPLQYQRADGRWLELRMFPLADGSRIKLWRDVTAELAPGTDGSQLLGLMTVVNVGLTLHDANGKLLYINSRFFSENFLGLINAVPDIKLRHERGDYWRQFGEIFEESPEYSALRTDSDHGPLKTPVILRAKTGKFYRIQEQLWNGGIASVWTNVTELMTRENALKSAHAELMVLNNRLLDMAEHDALTGMPNRRRFNAALADAQALVRNGSPCAVGLLDLDHFKSVNDRFGHEAGDSVLVEMAKRLNVAMEPGDVLARLGGEEFGIIFRRATLPEATAAAHKLNAALSTQPFAIGSASVTLTCSIGLAALNTLREPTVSLRQADMALYEAKNAGRNRVLAERLPEAAQQPDAPDEQDIGTEIVATLQEDGGLDAAQLRTKYEPTHGEHPTITREMWARALAERRTLDHYWGWVDYRVSLALDLADTP
ncbi:hypothetical protein BH10PSE18_BH10PSE18_46870 [soil metagenome]